MSSAWPAGAAGAGIVVLTGVLVAALVTVLALLARRRSRARDRAHPVYRGTPSGDPAPRTVVAWQPDPPAGMPPGTVPQQPRTGPRP